MRWLSDETVNHLKHISAVPDLSGTRYRLVGRLAQGGMGTVYVVCDEELGREVALKVLSSFEASSETVRRLEREARILARLEHPGIVPVHERGTLPDGRPYYVMKLVKGERLDEVVRRQPPLSELLRTFERICEPVAFAHAHGVIHRDLKPENVMVGPFGEVLVMDWGVAKVKGVEEPVPVAGAFVSETETADGTVLGTPAYMAPEQRSGKPHEVDDSTDVYALGAILHFILEGRPPASPAEGSINGTRVSPRLRAIRARAMAARPSARYSSVRALAADVSRFVSGERVEAYEENVLERLSRWAYKYRAPILLVLTYLVMRGVLLVFFRL